MGGAFVTQNIATLVVADFPAAGVLNAIQAVVAGCFGCVVVLIGPGCDQLIAMVIAVLENGLRSRSGQRKILVIEGDPVPEHMAVQFLRGIDLPKTQHPVLIVHLQVSILIAGA